jgi:two-component system response regulator AtoC
MKTLPVASPVTGAFELILHTRRESRIVRLTPGKVTIGRANENDIAIEDASVSRHHLNLTVTESSVEAEDLGSANGSSVLRAAGANLRLTPHERVRIEPGDLLRLGGVPLVLQTCRFSSLGPLPPSPQEGQPLLRDPAMRRVYDLAARTGGSDISVLVLGETGVGKELMAETLHRNSERRRGPLLKLNCAALPEALLEGELFGYERGAFTGAHTSKAGLLEATHGGSVFLDEIGELPLSTQAKLLRVLEGRSVLRLGSSKPREVDVRFIAATNRDLSKEARAGRFREDLYYRVSGMILRIPPLRDRPSEIEPLANHFVRAFCARMGTPQLTVSQSAIDVLVAYSWPGNVRELRNVSERAALVANGSTIEREHVMIEPRSESKIAIITSSATFGQHEATTAVFNPIPARPPETSPGAGPGPSSDRDRERQQILDALERCSGNQTRAAALLGIARRTLINRIIEHGLPRPRKN